MTDKILKTAKDNLPSSIDVSAVTCLGAPPAIQGPEDADLAKPILLENLRKCEMEGVDLCVISCFDDPGLTEATKQSSIPVLGIGRSAFTLASLMPEKFAVLTTVQEAVPTIEVNLNNYSLMQFCENVVASNIPVLDFEKHPEKSKIKMEKIIEKLLESSQLGSIVLGCAGMADLAEDFREKFKIPIIDGVAASALLGVSLLGVKNGP